MVLEIVTLHSSELLAFAFVMAKPQQCGTTKNSSH